MITADHKHLTSLVVSRLKKDLKADNVSVRFVDSRDSIYGDTAEITFYFDCFPDFTTKAPIEDIKRIMRGPNGDSLYAEVVNNLKKMKSRTKAESGDGAFYCHAFPSSPEEEVQAVSLMDAILLEYKTRKSPPSPPTPLAPPMKNYENIIQLAQDEIMTTIDVALDERGTRYAYRCPKELAKTLTTDSLVLVPAHGDAFSDIRVGKVIEVHAESKIEAGGRSLRLVVGVVYLTDFLAQITKEADMVDRLKKLDAEESRKKAKTDVLAALTLSEKQVLGLAKKDEDDPFAQK